MFISKQKIQVNLRFKAVQKINLQVNIKIQFRKMDQKQKLLRQQILQKGYDPSKFYDYWQTLQLVFQNVDLQQLKIIVQTYVQTLLLYRKQQQEEQFDNFQQSSYQESNKIILQNDFNASKAQTDIYKDFDWDLLIGKNIEKKPQSQNNKLQINKKDIKKLPKSFKNKQLKISQQRNAKLQSHTAKQQSKSMQNQFKPNKNQSNNKKIKQANLLQGLGVSLVQGNKNQIPETSYIQPQLNIQINNNLVQKSFSITFKQLQSQSTKQKIKCLKLQQNILNHHKNVQITITNVQDVKQENGIINKLWKGADYLYTIKTVGRNKNRSIGISWEIKRKYSDFQWLKNTLLKFYPGIVIPPMPALPKNKEKLAAQMKKLENFLMDAYRCPQLRNSKYFQVFLSYGNFSDFQGFKKSTQTVSKPKQLSNVLNMKGQIDLLYGPNVELFSTGIQQYLTKSSQHLKNVKSILKQIKDFYDSISECYTRLSQVFQLMSHQSCQFSEQKSFPKLTKTYKQIASLIQKHSLFCNQQKSNIDSYMVAHFSYEKDRIDNMQTLITKKNYFTAQLSKKQPPKDKQGSGSMFGKITGGVASLFGEKSQSLQIPSSNYQKLYKQVGFYNNQLLTQMIRCVQGMIQSQITHFSGYGISRIDSVDKLQKTWSQIMVQLSKLNVMQ